MHHHPSIRVGIIVSGEGECLVPENRIPLTPGCTFIIPAGLRHCFRTTNRELLVVAYHPDSDFGPTHECHPMVNRTIITENDHSTLFGQTGEEPKKRTYIP